MRKSELSPEQIFSEQANRLYEIGQLFLDIYPIDKNTGRSSRIFHLWITEDAKLPEWIDPKDDLTEADKHNREYNERMRTLPTSIQSNTDYFVAYGEKPGEVRIVTEHTRVDQGYKTPTIEFPDLGDSEKNNQQIAKLLAQHFISLRNRTPEERADAEGERVLRDTLLTHEVTEIVTSPEFIAQNRLVILQHDLMTGLNSETTVDFSIVTKDIQTFLFMIEFNFLSEMKQQSAFNKDLAPEHRERMKAIINDFLGK